MSIDDQPLTLGDFKRLMAEHEENEFAQQNEMLEKCMAGFPNGEPEPHRHYHQRKIDAVAAEREFWVAAKLKLLEHGIGGLIKVLWIIVGLAIFGLSVKLGLKIPFIAGLGV